MIEWFQDAFHLVVQGAILLMECIGVIIMVVTAIKSVCGVLRHDPHVRIDLAEGIGLALEFKLGGEVLRTLIVRTFNELAILAAVLTLRAAITFLIQWEIQTEKKRLASETIEANAPKAAMPAHNRRWRLRGVQKTEPAAAEQKEQNIV